MTQKNQIYRCDICGIITEVLQDGIGQLVCCGKKMQLVEGRGIEPSMAQFSPVLKKEGEGFRVKIGEVPHPMETNHYIKWIEIISDSAVYRKALKPGDKPEAYFALEAEKVSARAFCMNCGLYVCERS